jgi:hypothetical protein
VPFTFSRWPTPGASELHTSGILGLETLMPASSIANDPVPSPPVLIEKDAIGDVVKSPWRWDNRCVTSRCHSVHPSLLCNQKSGDQAGRSTSGADQRRETFLHASPPKS